MTLSNGYDTPRDKHVHSTLLTVRRIAVVVWQAAAMASLLLVGNGALTALSAQPISFELKWGSNGAEDGQFSSPQLLAVDDSGNVYVADEFNQRIQKFTSSGTFLTKWGSEGSGDGQFNCPVGVAVDDSGNVYVADRFNHRIQKFTSSGTFMTKWGAFGTGDGEFSQPYGVAVDGLGDVYVADQFNHRIQKFTGSGTFVTQWGSFGTDDGQFNQPVGVVVDDLGNTYVGDQFNHRIQKFTSSGTFVQQWGSLGTGGGQFNQPSGVAVDGSGNVYVVDLNNHRIQKFISSGTLVTEWGSLGTGDGQFLSPRGVAVDSSGHVYVADTSNHRIQKFLDDSVQPFVLSIIDVQNDQGRNVRISVLGASQDTLGSPTPILQYEAFRRIEELPNVAGTAVGNTATTYAELAASEMGMVSDARILLEGWEFVGAVPAHGEVVYSMIAPTLEDSTISSGLHLSAFFVRAATAEPLVFFDSPPDSGYSLDNLAPFVPVFTALFTAGVGYELEWGPSPDADLQYYNVYRGSRPDFDVLPEDDPVHQTIETEWIDEAPTGASYYKLSAVDFSGNESDPRPAGLSTDVDERLPTRFALHQNVPNPFNPRTLIRYAVPAGGGEVQIHIFDVAGRLVRTLVDRPETAGSKSVVWDGRDSHHRGVPAGIYLYRLTGPGVKEIRKMTLLK